MGSNTDSDEREKVRIVVCVKQVIDLSQIRFKSDGRTPVLEGLPLLIGAFEKNAVEEAVRIKGAREDVQVIALAAGSAKLKDTIKEPLAMGADEAVLVIDTALEASDALGSATILAAAIEKIGEADLILCGEGSDDEYTGQVPTRIAELMDLPQITTVRGLEIMDDSKVRATRDLEGYLETVDCEPPVVISVTSELNTPRLPPLTAILKAGRKPVQEWSLADIGVGADLVGMEAAQVRVLSSLAPEQDRKNIILEGTLEEQLDALLRALEHEGALQ